MGELFGVIENYYARILGSFFILYRAFFYGVSHTSIVVEMCIRHINWESVCFL